MGKRSDGFERRERGFYPTPWAAFEPLVPHLTPGSRVAEPCAGDGALCNHLANVGFSPVWASDITPRHPMVAEVDARLLKFSPELFDLIVTNPPWPLPRQNGEPTMSILRHLAALAPTWALLPADFMHNVYAGDLMAFCHHIVSVGRVRWIEGTANDGKDNCCWYLFDRRRHADRLAFTPRQPKRAAA